MKNAQNGVIIIDEQRMKILATSTKPLHKINQYPWLRQEFELKRLQEKQTIKIIPVARFNVVLLLKAYASQANQKTDKGFALSPPKYVNVFDECF